MSPPSTADLSESFAHLTLDNTDKLSTSDDLSIHSLHDLQAFLELARQHDSNAQNHQSADSQNPEFAAISSHLTPLVKDSKSAHTSGPVLDTITEDNHINKPMADMDGAALFRALQPFIEQYIAQKSDQHTSQKSAQFLSPYARHVLHDPDSDLDLKVEDTFDKIRPRSGSIRAVSPMTTPPQSSESHLTDSRGTFVDGDMCKSISHEHDMWVPPPSTETRTLAHKHLDLETPLTNVFPSTDVVANGQAPLVELPDPAMHKSDMGELHAKSYEQDISELRSELEHYKQDIRKLVEELRFVRSQLNTKHDAEQALSNHEARDYAYGTGSSTKSSPNADRETNNMKGTSKDAKDTSNTIIQDDKLSRCANNAVKNIDETSISDEFKPYYQRLQLAKVDELTSLEKSNLIKNIMLSLLVSDFDHLPSTVPQVGSYIRMTSQFLDHLHAHLYQNNKICPLRYLCDYTLHTDDGLQECLDGMLNRIM